MRAKTAVLSLALVAAAVLTDPAHAQETTASPLAATPSVVVSTAPESCRVEPRPMSFLQTLVEAPDPETTPVPLTGLPDGSPPDETVRAEVTTTVTTLIACVNAGDVLRAFALYEDGYLRRVVDPESAMTAEIANEIVVSFATPEPVAADRQTALLGVPLVRQLPDGRVAVVIETNGGVADDDEETSLDLLILIEVDGRWLIVDGLQGLERGSIPTG